MIIGHQTCNWEWKFYKGNNWVSAFHTQISLLCGYHWKRG
jgi:hypothetical protein